MRGRPEDIRALVALNGGTLIGRTRLQKTMFILEACGLGYGFDFLYHYYGPFSEALSIAENSAEVLKVVDVKEKETDFGTRYYVYKIPECDSKASVDPDEKKDADRTKILKILNEKEHDSIVVELAATVMFLQKNGYETDEKAWEETKLRKSAKATPERVEIAKQLLAKISQFRDHTSAHPDTL